MRPSELVNIYPVETEIAGLREQLKGKFSTVALDGPAAAGKGTLAANFTREFNLTKIETGRLYRSVTWLILNSQLEPENLTDEELNRLLGGFTVRLELNKSEQRVLIEHYSLENRTDITDELENPEIGSVISGIASRSAVRDFVDRLAIAIFSKGQSVIEGRDMWQVAKNQADVLIYIWADDDTLITREMERQASRGKPISRDRARQLVVSRNIADTKRERGRLMTPQEAIDSGFYDAVIDTSKLSDREVLLEVMRVMSRKVN